MKRSKTLYLKAVGLVCALLLLVVSAMPLLNSSTDAALLGLIFGAFGSGAMLADLIHHVRKGRGTGGS